MRDKVMRRLEIGDSKLEEEKKRRKERGGKNEGNLTQSSQEMGYRGRGEE
jgi:hypothetical protein